MSIQDLEKFARDIEKRQYAITRKSDGFYFHGLMFGAEVWQSFAVGAIKFNLRTSANMAAVGFGFKLQDVEIKRLANAG